MFTIYGKVEGSAPQLVVGHRYMCVYVCVCMWVFSYHDSPNNSIQQPYYQ